jgi:uracil-DNA glycosylase family 4
MMEPWSPEWKELRYAELREVWKNCQKCELCKERKRMVFGAGNLNAKLMFIGECPGVDEDKEGQPFRGDSGKLLMGLLDSVDVTREEIFMDNLVICRPPKDRTLLAQEKEVCFKRLNDVIYLVDPLLIVAVGKTAFETLVGRSCGIEKAHGSLFSSPHPDVRVPGEKNGIEITGKIFPRKGPSKREYTLDYDIVPIYDPSYILRQDSYDKKTKSNFAQGGLAHQTVDDLAAIVKRMKQLEKEYRDIQGTVERMSE